MSGIDVSAAAAYLDEAQRTATAVRQLSANPAATGAGELDVATAYRVQAAAYRMRLDRGESAAGVKLGFTSRAKMAQMGISEIIVGRLTERMRIADGDAVDLDDLIHPRIEPEIAYLLAEDIGDEDTGTDASGLDRRPPPPSAVAAVAPALEIIDSRYRDFSFSLADVVADNASSARYAIGPWQRPDRDVGNLAVRLDVGGRLAEVGSTAAILGHPYRALHRLVRLGRDQGIPLRAGDVVLAGAATAAVPFIGGLAECAVAGLGRVQVRGSRND
ncbi:2-keto-4-pentenoate hydratase [Micromonospora sp. LOL_021]|uniref:2-keto-4-pentenoate hydratase n=1 Tax=Micromonospora sp. LOL_021 TaxID=3345417 RepID=UPI003A8BE9AF